jgi:hypothetical protein
MTPKQASIKAPAELSKSGLRSVEAAARGDRNAQEAAIRLRFGERAKSDPKRAFPFDPGTDGEQEPIIAPESLRTWRSLHMSFRSQAIH